jgi:hypothetical protein
LDASAFFAQRLKELIEFNFRRSANFNVGIAAFAAVFVAMPVALQFALR